MCLTSNIKVIDLMSSLAHPPRRPITEEMSQRELYLNATRRRVIGCLESTAGREDKPVRPRVSASLEWVKLSDERGFLCAGFEMHLKLGGAGAGRMRARIT